MTRYKRRGHWRTSAHGTRHWVNTHDVNRSSGRWSPPRRRTYSASIPRATTVSTPVAGWISPNARCPVCGASVYFYANQHGSRVFFDDLGPPWPKHPCTDTGATPVATPGDRQAPSRHDFSTAQPPGIRRDRDWKTYAVKKVSFGGGYSRITLQRIDGTGSGPAWAVAGQTPLRADDLVFVRNQRMSYFDAASGGPVIAENAGRAAALAGRLVTDRDKDHVLANLDARVIDGELIRVTEDVRAARTRGDIARALKIDVTDLKVAPPRPVDLWLLALGFVLMVAVTSTTNGPHSYLVMLPGLSVTAVAVYRLNPDMERARRIALALVTTLFMICPAGALGGMIQVEILGR
ncbi:hypothetical protein [Actinoplanes utahensis]|uniref:Uncharacterized protein n=1 Tax=Actinoplanes utahensis TaxID=1869 RepID=A0A0A6USM5_ACTUT|nr:hypothetical protein [Actinoplanes utahensis]KHD77454.1 hypothetical protein MB27_09975 [Actinoplanes utahensis]GIF32578.1 hypothetical protein Aut01nite_55640 [Actinoplanes utahensis]